MQGKYMFRHSISALFFGMALSIAPLCASSMAASEESAPYIQKAPKDGIFKIVVLGDSLADGLHQGLTQTNKDRDDIKTTKTSKVNTGLVRVDRYNWNKGAAKIAKSGKYQIAVVLLGLNDLQSIREKGKAHHFKTDGWVERYTAKVETMMSDLKAGNLAVYWTGIPIVTPKHYQDEYLYLNGIYKAAAEKVGVKFVDTWAPLADKDGKYTPFHRDSEGKISEIRNKDGVHFTPSGYLIFAGFVDDIIKQDMKTILADSKNETMKKSEGESQ